MYINVIGVCCIGFYLSLIHISQHMGHLRLTRKQVSFSRAGKTTIERIACANSGDHPLKLNALLLPSCLKFYTEPAVLAPGQEGDLVITLDKAKLPSFHGKNFQIATTVQLGSGCVE